MLDAPTLITRNRQFHNWFRDGVEVEYRRDDGSIAGDRVRLIDFDNPPGNDFLAVNQFAVREAAINGFPTLLFSSTDYRWQCLS